MFLEKSTSKCFKHLIFWEFTLSITPPPPPQKKPTDSAKKRIYDSLPWLLGASSKSSEKSSTPSPSFPMAREVRFSRCMGGVLSHVLLGHEFETKKGTRNDRWTSLRQPKLWKVFRVFFFVFCVVFFWDLSDFWTEKFWWLSSEHIY